LSRTGRREGDRPVGRNWVSASSDGIAVVEGPGRTSIDSWEKGSRRDEQRDKSKDSREGHFDWLVAAEVLTRLLAEV
jgi:hypothetical protein